MTSTRPYRKGMLIHKAITLLGEEKDSQFDGKILSYFIDESFEEPLGSIVGHSDHGIPLVQCKNCGPVITVSKNTRDGDIVYCKVCGQKIRLHKKGDIFDAEPLKNEFGNADDLKPEAAIDQIDALLRETPSFLEV
jgi:hypothetical protein